MALRVIGAGLGRTGTTSLKLALEALGFARCYHMIEVLMGPRSGERIAQWDAITSGSTADWPAVFEGYQATVDWPACNYYPQLMAAWPDAKIILTVRQDAGVWFDSTQATILAERSGGPAFVPRLTKAILGPDLHDRDAVIAAYERHNAGVRAAVPAGRLLEFAPDGGWVPLCTFLEVPVPDVPYPKLNTTADFRSMIAARSS